MVLLYLGPLSQLAGRAVWGNKSRVESLPEEDNKKMLLPLFSRLICSQKDIKSSIILHHKVMSPWAVWPTENISLCATAAFGHIPFQLSHSAEFLPVQLFLCEQNSWPLNKSLMLFQFNHMLLEVRSRDQGKAPYTKPGHGAWVLFLTLSQTSFFLFLLCYLPLVCIKGAKSKGRISVLGHGYPGSGTRGPRFCLQLYLFQRGIGEFSLCLCAHSSSSSNISKSQVVPGRWFLLLLLLLIFPPFVFEQRCLWSNKLQPL